MNIVKELRKKKGVQQKELAIAIGVAQPTVSEWELNKKDPSGERLKKLAEYFNVDELVVLGKNIISAGYVTIDKDGRYRRISNEFIPINNNSIPIIGDIACGTPITAEQNVDGYADLPGGVHADFALRCKGDSMAPTFLDGDIVLIRQQPEVENGQIAAVGINGEATLKHLYRTGEGFLLVADNPKFAPIQVSEGNTVDIYGLAIGYTRIFEGK